LITRNSRFIIMRQ